MSIFFLKANFLLAGKYKDCIMANKLFQSTIVKTKSPSDFEMSLIHSIAITLQLC